MKLSEVREPAPPAETCDTSLHVLSCSDGSIELRWLAPRILWARYRGKLSEPLARSYIARLSELFSMSTGLQFFVDSSELESYELAAREPLTRFLVSQRDRLSRLVLHNWRAGLSSTAKAGVLELGEKFELAVTQAEFHAMLRQVAPLNADLARAEADSAGMKVELLSASDPTWGSVLARVQHDFYHIPEYVALAAQPDGEACALHVRRGECHLLLPLVRREVSLKGHTDLSSPYGYPGPLLHAPHDSSFLQDAMEAGLEFLRAQGVVSLFVRLHPLLEVPTGPLASLGTIVEHGSTVCIDLRRGPASTWADMRKSHRYEIRRSQRQGLVVHQDSSWKKLPEFVSLYTATMRRRGARAQYFFPERYFTDLRDALGERLTLWIASAGDRVLAGSLFTEVGGIVQYHLSASAEDVNGEPTKLIIDAVRRWAHERGDTDLHLGGGVGCADDSLLFFKSGFSSRRCVFRSWRVVIDAIRYRDLVQEFAPEAQVLEPVGFFPVYRRP